MITKKRLRSVIGEWIKPMCQECEGIGGYWNYGSDAGLFYWALNNGSSDRNRAISARLCYDQNSHHTGYIIYLNLDDDHPIIKIEGDDMVFDANGLNDWDPMLIAELKNSICKSISQNSSEIPDNYDSSEFFKIERVFEMSKFQIGDLFKISYQSEFNKKDPCTLLGFLIMKDPKELKFAYVEDVNCTTEGKIETCTVTPHDIETGVSLEHVESGRVISK